MNLEVFTCSKCGVKQPSDGIFCYRCGAKTDYGLPTLKKAGGDTQSEMGHCRYCNSVIDLNKIESHNDSCAAYPIYCNFCNDKFIRSTMSSHVQECVRYLRKCKFSPIGCEFQGNQLEVEKHESGNSHAELMMKLLLTLQTEQSSNGLILERLFSGPVSRKSAVGSSSGQNECCKEMKVLLEKQEKEMNDLRLEQRSFKEMFDEQSKQMQKLAEDVKLREAMLTKQQTEQCDNLENYQKTLTTVIMANNQLTKAVAEDKKILIDKIDAVVRKQIEFEENYAKSKEMDLKNKLTGFSSFKYIWKIDNFADMRLLRPNYSDYFYTKENGYKMRLMLFLHPNGSAKRKESHLSVSLQVMKGTNDAFLHWPIQYHGRLHLIDQLTGTSDYSHDIKSDIINFKDAFDRPTHAVANVRFEIAEFIPFGENDPKYLVNGKMFFELDLNVTG